MSAAALHHLSAGTALSSSVGTDAELIAVCDTHRAKIDAYNGSPGMTLDEAEKHPLWLAYSASRDFINQAKPKTIDGIRAMARAAKAEVQGLEDDDSVAGTPAEFWSVEIIIALVDGIGEEPQQEQAREREKENQRHEDEEGTPRRLGLVSVVGDFGHSRSRPRAPNRARWRFKVR